MGTHIWKQWPMPTIEGAVSDPVSVSSYQTPHSCSPLRKRNTSTWRRGSRMDHLEYALLFPCSHISPRYILVQAKPNDHGQELSMEKMPLTHCVARWGHLSDLWMAGEWGGQQSTRRSFGLLSHWAAPPGPLGLPSRVTAQPPAKSTKPTTPLFILCKKLCIANLEKKSCH